jgi:hypothetical protein
VLLSKVQRERRTLGRVVYVSASPKMEYKREIILFVKRRVPERYNNLDWGNSVDTVFGPSNV